MPPDARGIRPAFTVKREEADRKRDELLAAQAALVTDEVGEKEIDRNWRVCPESRRHSRELDALEECREYYESRKPHQKPRCIASPPRWKSCALVMGERPASIKATAKERGDILTDQISMCAFGLPGPGIYRRSCRPCWLRLVSRRFPARAAAPHTVSAFSPRCTGSTPGPGERFCG